MNCTKPRKSMLGRELGDRGHSRRSRMHFLVLSLRHRHGLLLLSVKKRNFRGLNIHPNGC